MSDAEPNSIVVAASLPTGSRPVGVPGRAEGENIPEDEEEEEEEEEDTLTEIRPGGDDARGCVPAPALAGEVDSWDAIVSDGKR